MIAVTICRKTLVKHGACDTGIALFDTIAALQPESDMRRSKRIRVANWTQLHGVWLLVLHPGFSRWLEEKQLIPRANLSGADLRGANMRGANLYGANLRGADLSGADLYGSNLYGSNLYGSNLSGADLRGSNLYGSNLYGSNLSGADLSGSNLYGSNLYGSKGCPCIHSCGGQS